MPNMHDPLSDLSSPMQQALTWFARLRNENVSDREKQNFEAWRQAHPDHDKAYQLVVHTWQSNVLDIALETFSAIPPAAKAKPSAALRWAATAVLSLLLGVGIVYSGWLERWQADYYTLPGQQQAVQLADGSKVLLNSDTVINVEFGNAQRGVKLLQGEAYFEVTPDANRPFTVNTKLGNVQVLGTQFAVRADTEISVDVESGKVACSDKQGKTEHLLKGQHVAISKQGLTAPKPFDKEQTFAWLKGRLIFRDQPLASVIQELQRYQSGKIFITDSHLANKRISGNYKLNDTQALLANLAHMTGAKIRHFSPLITVLGP